MKFTKIHQTHITKADEIHRNSVKFVSCGLTLIQELESHKKEGNKLYQQGQSVANGLPKMMNSQDQENLRRFYYQQACVEYGKGIEEIMKYENNQISLLPAPHQNNNQEEIDLIIQLKQQYFLNLGIVNYLLNDSFECLRCCNASIVFCNEIDLLLSDLGRDHDLTSPVTVFKPVNPKYHKHVAKVLFWRAKALFTLGEMLKARDDAQESIELQPQDPKITSLLLDINKALNVNKDQSIPSLVTSHLQLELFPELTHNGGWCCQRQGLWSQSVNEVLVYLPEQYIQSALKLVNPEYGMSSPLQKSEIKVEFQSNSVSVLSFMGSVLFLNLCLFKQIDPSNSFWCLEHHNSFLFLVLYLQKVFPVTDTPLPGMEWWECVCDGDERIDTLLCTIGTNVTELPFHAKIRAEKEHQRYLNLSSTDQEKEIQYLIQMKQEFSKSMERTALERENEELSMQEIPERAELLRQLREEFPHISFVSK